MLTPLLSIVPQLMRKCEMIAESQKDATARTFAMNGVVKHSKLRTLWLGLLGSAVFLCSCSREEERGEAPPAPEAGPVNVCEGVSRTSVIGLPATVGKFCVDPNADVRTYGAIGSSPLDGVCVELFNGECEVYKSYGLEGVKTLHYVEGGGRSVTVNVVVSSFRRSNGAYGFFTRRVLGNGLPSQVTVKSLPVKGRAVSGVGTVVVWRGKDVVELTYVSEEATPEEIEMQSPKILEPIARAVSEELVGDVEPERAVRFLEALHADNLGVSVLVEGLLGVSGTGPGAMGYFSKGPKPHRIAIAERRDKPGAEDLLGLLRRSGSGKKLKGSDVTELRLTREGAAPETWYLRRNDDAVLAVGPLDEPEADPETSTPKDRKAEQAAWKDFAFSRLMEVSGEELKFGQ